MTAKAQSAEAAVDLTTRLDRLEDRAASLEALVAECRVLAEKVLQQRQEQSGQPGSTIHVSDEVKRRGS